MAARAMDNFGFSKLSIVNPRDGWPSKKAARSAKHADKIINNLDNPKLSIALAAIPIFSESCGLTRIIVGFIFFNLFI